jgi:hypothetical protein
MTNLRIKIMDIKSFSNILDWVAQASIKLIVD